MNERFFWLPRSGEWRAVGLAFGYFFCLIGAYMMLRPVRETLAVRAGDTEVLFSLVFLVMLVIAPVFGWMVAHFPKRVFLPLSYVFFIANLLGFGIWLSVDPTSIFAAKAFFVWISVFNLFVVSVFWSLMIDIFKPEQGRRLFGLIAAGGSLGGITGPSAAVLLVESVGISGLILCGASLLSAALFCQWKLLPSVKDRAAAAPMGGGILAGATALIRHDYLRGIGWVLLFLPLIQTLIYFLQLEMVGNAFESEADRVRWFGAVDTATQVIGAVLQFALTSVILKRFGAAMGLVIMPIVTVIGLLALAIAPGMAVLAVFQAVRRGGEYGLMKPARELLFTRVSEEDKYKAKNFIDTAVYRGGDVASGWIARGLLGGLGLGAPGIAAVAILPAMVWAWISHGMGRRFEQMSRRERGSDAASSVRIADGNREQ